MPTDADREAVEIWERRTGLSLNSAFKTSRMTQLRNWCKFLFGLPFACAGNLLGCAYSAFIFGWKEATREDFP